MTLLEQITAAGWTVVATQEFEGFDGGIWKWKCDNWEMDKITDRIADGRVISAQRKASEGVYELVVRRPKNPPRFITVRANAGGLKRIPNPDVEVVA